MREIVLGVRGNDNEALSHAVQEATLTGLPLRLVRVERDPVRNGETLVRARTELDTALGEAHKAAKGAGSLAITGELLRGDPGAVLTKLTGEASLLVLGTRRRGRIHDALLGSVANHVTHHATGPVMVVPDSARDHHGRVLVGVDGSASARSALEWAAAAARRHDCPLVVMHAWLITTVAGMERTGYMPPLEDFRAGAQRWLEEELARVLPERTGLQLELLLPHGGAAASLLEASVPQDMVVLGSRGQGGFAKLLLGSVAAQLTQHAQCPVVLVRAGLGGNTS